MSGSAFPLPLEIGEAADYVREKIQSSTGVGLGWKPRIGMVLGSGLGGLVESVENPLAIPYAEIPGFSSPTVPGHRGMLVLGSLGGKSVAVLVGRLHLYEGHAPEKVVFPIRLLWALGCQTLIVTNAAGGLNSSFSLGDLMAITDHLFLPGFAGQSPLSGPDRPEFGSRFVDMKGAYSPALVDLAQKAADRLRIPLKLGVYAMVAGPSYETPAEVRFLRAIGADAVGMSTAPEVVAARQLGMKVLGFSLITNLSVSDLGSAAEVSHAEVLSTGMVAGPKLANLIREIIAEIE